MHQIPVFQIQPEPDLVKFMNSNLAGAEARFGNRGLQMQCGCIKSNRTKLWTLALLICQQQM